MTEFEDRLENLDEVARAEEINAVLAREKESDLYGAIRILLSNLRAQAVDTMRVGKLETRDVWMQIGKLRAADLLEDALTIYEEDDDA